MVKKLYNWWLPEALDLINESLGINFYDGSASINNLNIEFVNRLYSPGFENSSFFSKVLLLETNSDGTATLKINTAFTSNLSESDKEGELGEATGFNFAKSAYNYRSDAKFDILLTDTLAELTLRANIPYFDYLPISVQDGLKYIVAGYDFTSNSSGNYYMGTLDEKAFPETSYTLMRYLAKTYSEQNDTTKGLEYNDNKTSVTITSDYSDTKLGYDAYESTVVTITGASRSIGLNIEGNDKANVITGTRGADTINGGKGNDTLTGGSGNDVFLYEYGEGSDVITDYTANQDSISIDGGTVSDAKISGSDVVLTIGRNTLTLNNAVDKNIKIADEQNEFTTLVSGNSSSEDTIPSSEEPDTTILTIDNYTSSPVIAAQNYITINAKSRTTAVNITGNTKANSIVGGYGADTLNGSSGNDTLTGGGGRNVFLYESGDGDDVITDYTVNRDIIRITYGSISKAVASGNDVVLTVGSGKITVKNAKGKALTLVNSSGRSSTTVVGGSSTSTTSGGTSKSTLKSGLSYSTDKKTLTVKSPFTGTIDLSKYASTVTIVNASADTKFVSIKGTTRAETLRAGKGGSILTGGKGNDKLYGGTGADTFIYANGDGKDTVYNYTPYIDTIKITSGNISKASVSGNNVILTVGSGSITINNAKGKDINIMDKSGNTATYNFTGTVNNPTTSNYEERWFAEDDNNYTTSEVNSILKSKNLISNDYKIESELNLNKSVDITSLTYSQLKK